MASNEQLTTELDRCGVPGTTPKYQDITVPKSERQIDDPINGAFEGEGRNKQRGVPAAGRNYIDRCEERRNDRAKGNLWGSLR